MNLCDMDCTFVLEKKPEIPHALSHHSRWPLNHDKIYLGDFKAFSNLSSGSQVTEGNAELDRLSCLLGVAFDTN